MLDVLGAGFEPETLELGSDDEGRVVATLVRHRSGHAGGRAVLYVHGLADYFFQLHLAGFFVDQGWDFYALDLRKHGRSLLSHQTPNFMRDVSDYFPDIDRAVELIRERDGHHTLVINAHSTGGLITPIWAEARKGDHVIDGLILNSPFFELNEPWVVRRPIADAISALAPLAPRVTVKPGLDPAYVKSLHVDFGGEWNFNLAWKPVDGFPVRAAMIRAFRTAQEKVQAGLTIDVPILVGASGLSPGAHGSAAAARTADVILNVADIVQWSGGLGADVRVLRFEHAVHDLVLSRSDVRARVFTAYGSWLREVVTSQIH
ncbi:alpha/beta hydrolase [Actinoplanes sp. NBRC 103695]|nr:alpha/beta hydrolase [Actinoplanes sp. NBRC 103695]